VVCNDLSILEIIKLIEVDLCQAQWLLRSNFTLQTVKDSNAINVTQEMRDSAVVIEPARYYANISIHHERYVCYAPTPEMALATSYRKAMERQG